MCHIDGNDKVTDVIPWDEILAAVAVSQTSDRADGRQRLMGCWSRTGPADHAHRCVLAHYLADVQTTVADELRWDELALAEHAHLADGALAAVGIPSARGMLPSLHLNLGDGRLRDGDAARARRHLRLGMAAAEALGEDGYAAMIRAGLQRLAARVEAAEAAS